MNKQSVAAFFRNTNALVIKHSPEILTGVGIAGMITTTVFAVKATPKALALIEQKKKEEKVDRLTPMETVKAAWKPYIPAIVIGTLSVSCIVGASSVHLKRNTALATAYKLSETALTEYREQVIDTIGEKKEQTIREKVNQKQIEKTPASTSEVHVTGKGETLCLEPLSGRYFKSDIDRIRKAENTLNKQMLHDICGFVSLNEFFE